MDEANLSALMNTEAVDPSEPTESSDPADFPDTLALEPEYIAALTEMYEEKILFNQWMGLRVVNIKPKGIEARLTMKPELVGHFAYHRIHGGVISAVLDVMGSLAIMAAMGAKYKHEPLEARLARFAGHSTIDLRIDFLRPAIGDAFNIRAAAVRVGARLGNARMEFCAADGKLLSTGTAAYFTS
jgi:uncharacterized protein (TIGR00369 family)